MGSSSRFPLSGKGDPCQLADTVISSDSLPIQTPPMLLHRVEDMRRSDQEGPMADPGRFTSSDRDEVRESGLWTALQIRFPAASRRLQRFRGSDDPTQHITPPVGVLSEAHAEMGASGRPELVAWIHKDAGVLLQGHRELLL